LPLGFADDIAVLSATLATVSAFIDEQVRQLATRKLAELLGNI
jgi:uncharacterized membrane protein YkvA (DUF1232 family)